MLEKKTHTPELDQKIYELGRTKILSHSCQLFSKEGKYGYKPYGSGVCLKLSDNYFIVTASHVTEGKEELDTLYVKGDGKFIPIIGEIRETDIDKNSHIDLAYIKLDNSIIDGLNYNHKFLPIDKIRGNHVLLDATQYCVLGYPEKNIRIEEGKVETGASCFVVPTIDAKVYEYYKLDPKLNIALKFAGKGEDMLVPNKRNKIEDPYGISGGGIWLILPSENEQEISIEYYLVGIVYGGRKGKYHILIGTKIDFLMQSMNAFGDINVRLKTK